MERNFLLSSGVNKDSVILIKYDHGHNKVTALSENLLHGITMEEAINKQIKLHRSGFADSNGWSIINGTEYMQRHVQPDENFIVRFVDIAHECGLGLTQYPRVEHSETRTSFRVSFTCGPIYNGDGYLDGYQDIEIIFHKDRAIYDYTVVYKQPDYIGRKHSLKDFLYEEINQRLDLMTCVRWIYERGNGDLYICDVADRSSWETCDNKYKRISPYIMCDGSRYYVTFEQSLGDAIDSFADSDLLGRPFTMEEVDEMYEEYPDDGPGAYGYVHAGNASEVFDINYMHFEECEIDKETGFLIDKDDRFRY